jgi:hypothetical protein
MNARLLLVLPFVVSCSRSVAEPDPSSSKSTPAAQPAQPAHSAAPTSAQPAKPSALAWDAPASFTKTDNPSPMRKATYKAPKTGSDTEQPELAVTVAGGSVDANVDRWVGQFDEGAKKTMVREQRKVGPLDITVVQLEGSFNGGGMPGAPSSPKTGYALLAAMVPLGDQSWFFKMTGPAASVKAAKKDFDAMVGSLRPGA